jgi:hypothetical protein
MLRCGVFHLSGRAQFLFIRLEQLWFECLIFTLIVIYALTPIGMKRNVRGWSLYNTSLSQCVC